MIIHKFLPTRIELDEVQAVVLSTLEQTASNLEQTSFFDIFKNNANRKNGIYLYGGVGRGKSMLMQAFYYRVKSKKIIIHYQKFMQSMHEAMHKLQGESTGKLLSKLAKEYANNTDVICIDELEIKDIADAMLIGKLFDELIKNKIFIITTSNAKPDNLYKDGLQRELFIDMINKKFKVLNLDNNHDYRMDKLTNFSNRILYPFSRTTKEIINKAVSDLTNNNNLTPTSLEIFGRQILFKKTYKTLLVTDYSELFLREFGYVDYVNICQRFSVIVLENVKIIPEDNTDLAIRFINFIDNAYFYKVILFITLEDAPENIYIEGNRNEEFKRTISRLYEMNSDDYLRENFDEVE
jgi:cell division protein ZapE